MFALHFKDPKLLHLAFIHRSYLNEHKSEPESNERLEFLGDATLSYVVSSWLYLQLPSQPEGILTNIRSNLVNTKSLARVATKLDLGQSLLLSKGEEDGGGRSNQSLLADTYEAVVGAILLDQGLEAVSKFIHETLLVDATLEVDNIKDPKSLLQEKVQAQKFPSPVYKVIAESGPDHDKVFTVEVLVDNKPIAQGSGKSKREAEATAAGAALSQLNN